MEDKILLVDDDAMLLAGMKRHLRNRFRIETALSGAEALKMIETNGPYAVIVSDFAMPEMNGIEFLSRIKQTYPGTVRMMLTGSSDMTIAVKAVNEGSIFKYLLKPCAAETLREALETGLEQYQNINRDRKQLNKVKESLAHAGEIQQTLMPATAPAKDGFDIAGKTISCDETGGDYYDFIDSGESGQERLGIVVGDVAGHGVSSALLMTTARAFLRERVRRNGGPANIISDVNKRLARDTGELGLFMSLFYAEIDIKEKHLRWVRAGHEPAILYDAKKESFEDLKGPGMSLGVGEEAVYQESLVPINPGQIIFIGTDGIKETSNYKGEMFGKNRLKKIIRAYGQKPAKEIITAVIDALARFRFPLEAEDDTTMVVIKVLS